MIKEFEIEIKGHRTNFDHFMKLGYDVQYRKSMLVKVLDLLPGSTAIITSICDNCLGEKKNEFRFYYEYTNGITSEYYCGKCNIIKRKKTCLDKYGVENPMQSESVRNKLKDTLIETYGVDHYSKTEDYKHKIKQTCLDKYGVNNLFKSDFHKEKIKSTNLQKYGVEYPQQNSEIKQKTTDAFLRKYGVDRYSQLGECKDKVRKTSQIKWGVDSFSQTQESKNQIKKTSMDKWGVDHYSKTQEFKSSQKKTREDLTKFRYDVLMGGSFEVIDYQDSNFRIIHKDCDREFEINRDQLYQRINLNICLCTKCLDINIGQSNMELEMQEFLNSLGLSYVVKDKSVLDGKELDIYLIDHNLAIEMNGVYWHSEIYLDKYYHRDKTLNCRFKGIDLLHIWEDDWKYKREIVKSIIRNKTNNIKIRIYARKCEIKSVTYQESVVFLDDNHIQGSAKSQERFGMYYNGELVSLMTFGYRFTNGKKEYELIRFCNKINTNVLGSASRLFSFFKKNFNISEVISYSDVSLFRGDLYDNLGFSKVNLSSPNYFWVIDGVRKHRFNFNKKRLIKLGYDPNQTEVEIMHSRGYYRIFSTGQEKWIFSK